MKAVEFKGKLSDIRMTLSAKYRGHNGLYFKLGNAIPTHLSQLKKFDNLGVLCQKDVELIDSIFSFSNTGKTAEYVFTKSKTFVRLVNFNDFKEALKLALQNDFKLA
jgi:hypothetical protein